jgi:hypothetical protein
MLQPFEVFRPVYFKKLFELKKTYLVSQTYKRAVDHLATDKKIPILLSDYSDLGLAKIHLNAVKHDKFAAILDLTNENHLTKLNEMLKETSQYRLYWAVVKSAKELQDRINKVYRDNMKRYIEKHTSWRIGRETTLYPSVQTTFGELFIILKYGSETLRIKFEEIENI